MRGDTRIRHALSERGPSAPTLDQVAALLAEHFGVGQVGIYRLAPAERGWRLDLRAHGGPEALPDVADRFERDLRSLGGRYWGLYDPRHVGPEHRRVLRCSWDHTPPAIRRRYAQFGMQACHSTRVVLADGPNLLAYVGAFDRRAQARPASRLSRLVRSLRDRIRLDLLLGPAQLDSDPLVSALEANPLPALVLSEAGVRHANSAARATPRALRGGRRLVSALSTGQATPGWSVSSLSFPAMPRHWLVVAHPGEVHAPKVRANAAHRLTRREAEVLALFGEGLPNKLVAERLGCSVRTVEQHATNLFAKLEVESRLEAVAKCLGRRT